MQCQRARESVLFLVKDDSPDVFARVCKGYRKGELVLVNLTARPQALCSPCNWQESGTESDQARSAGCL